MHLVKINVEEIRKKKKKEKVTQKYCIRRNFFNPILKERVNRIVEIIRLKIYIYIYIHCTRTDNSLLSCDFQNINTNGIIIESSNDKSGAGDQSRASIRGVWTKIRAN